MGVSVMWKWLGWCCCILVWQGRLDLPSHVSLVAAGILSLWVGTVPGLQTVPSDVLVLVLVFSCFQLLCMLDGCVLCTGLDWANSIALAWPGLTLSLCQVYACHAVFLSLLSLVHITAASCAARDMCAGSARKSLQFVTMHEWKHSMLP